MILERASAFQAGGLTARSRGVEERAPRATTPPVKRCKIRNPEGVIDVVPILGARQPFQGCTMMVVRSGGGVAEPPSPPATGDHAFGVGEEQQRKCSATAAFQAQVIIRRSTQANTKQHTTDLHSHRGEARYNLGRELVDP